MGRAIEALAREQGDEVVAVLGSDVNASARAIVADLAARVDVAVEFTVPASAADNVAACLAAGIPVVTGTTGWYEALPVLEREARRLGGALFWAPNFSLGVALVVQLAEAAGALFAPHPQFDAHLVETHHAAKQDAPSGTASAMAAAARRGLGRALPVTSVRVGHAPGTHTMVFDGPFEQIVLSHEARDRRVFADGALRAARWLVGRRGVFTMRDLIGAREGV